MMSGDISSIYCRIVGAGFVQILLVKANNIWLNPPLPIISMQLDMKEEPPRQLDKALDHPAKKSLFYPLTLL